MYSIVLLMVVLISSTKETNYLQNQPGLVQVHQYATISTSMYKYILIKTFYAFVKTWTKGEQREDL